MSAHAAVETALYQKTVRNSEVIDTKLRELVDAIGRIRECLPCTVVSAMKLFFQENWNQRWNSLESSSEHSVWVFAKRVTLALRV